MIRLISAGLFFAVVTILFVTPADAKSLVKSQRLQSAAVELRSAGFGAQAISRFESTLLPYFTARQQGNQNPATYHPTQEDYFAIVAVSKQLSAQFKTTYAKATAINTALNRSYKSPGGHIEVLYTTTGINSVQTTDGYGYGPDSLNWRTRIAGANGVPDYIDETAYGADSAFAMEVLRMGFLEPFPYTDNIHPSPLHKIAVVYFSPLTNAGEIYGYTIPTLTPARIDSPGYASYIELRNQWNGDIWNSPPWINYQRHPERGAWITCAHEFFHCCQFRMTRDLATSSAMIVLDDYPITWIEGTCVLMEELAFDSINDYIQYSKEYFDSTQIPILNTAHNGDVYSNSLAAMFLYQKFNGLDFIKNVYLRNYNTPIGFYTNLEITAGELGTTWNTLLGQFHSGSYFTSSRAYPPFFIKDAAYLPKWSYYQDVLNDTGAITKTIRPFAMRTFSFVNDPTQHDTLTIGFSGQDMAGHYWSVNGILRNKSASHDSLIPLPLQTNGSSSLQIDDWFRYDSIVVVVSNSHPYASRQATVSFDATDVFCQQYETISAITFADSSHNDSANSLRFSATATNALRGKLILKPLTLTSRQKSAAYTHGLLMVGNAYSALFQQIWADNAALSVVLTISNTVITTAERANLQPANTFKLCYWNEPKEQWDTLGAVYSTNAQTGQWSATIYKPGIYAVAAVYPPLSSIIAYPNPQKRTASTTIQGSPQLIIHEVVIYSVQGTAIAGVKPEKDNSGAIFTIVPYGVQWHAKNSSGTTVAPGTYIARIAYTTTPGGELQNVLKKIMVLP